MPGSRFVWEPGDVQVTRSAREAEWPLREYSDDEARDDHGRWTGGGGADVASAVQQAVASGGGTVNPTTGEQPTKGYAVAGTAQPTVMPRADLTRDAFRQWAVSNREALQQPGAQIGVWADKGQVWLEPSQVVADRQAAIDLAQQRNQIAIYDLSGKGEILTGGSGVVPGG